MPTARLKRSRYRLFFRLRASRILALSRFSRRLRRRLISFRLSDAMCCPPAAAEMFGRGRGQPAYACDRTYFCMIEGTAVTRQSKMGLVWLRMPCLQRGDAPGYKRALDVPRKEGKLVAGIQKRGEGPGKMRG